MLIMTITVMLIMTIMTTIITIIATAAITAVIKIIIAAALFIHSPSLFPVLHQFFLTDSWRRAPSSDLPLGTDRRAVAGCFLGTGSPQDTRPRPGPPCWPCWG